LTWHCTDTTASGFDVALHRYDWKKLAAEGGTHKERMEGVYMILQKLKDKLKNPRVVFSALLADDFESWDTGPGPAFYRDSPGWRGWKPPPRCNRGYYADFWVTSCLQDNSILIAHDDGFDAIELMNFPEDNNEPTCEPEGPLVEV